MAIFEIPELIGIVTSHFYAVTKNSHFLHQKRTLSRGSAEFYSQNQPMPTKKYQSKLATLDSPHS